MRLYISLLSGVIGITGFASSEEIPMTWDDDELQELVLPLADAAALILSNSLAGRHDLRLRQPEQ